MCWDQWYPEGARLTARKARTCCFIRTAIGWHPDEKAEYGEAQYDAWNTIQRAHAIANGVYVAVPNRVGFETGNIRGNVAPGKGLEFWGGSFIADPFGQIIAQASHDKEEVLIAEVDLQRIEDVRRNWPFWRDRRVDAYGPLLNGSWCSDTLDQMSKPHKLSQTPASLGYRMPAEWEPHEATWIAWPHNRSDWPGRFEPIPWVYAEIVRHLARVERVNILVEDEAAEVKVRELLIRAHVISERAGAPGKPAGNIRFYQIPTNRGWTRDAGPIFLRRDSRPTKDFPAVAATAWRFNAWAKYNDWKLDATIAGDIVNRLRMPLWEPQVKVNGHPRPIVLEGGSIDVNGCGTLITTEECLLSDVQQRNPGVTREQLEEIFADYLGVEKVIWLDRGIAGDDTHGHVDDITRFVSPTTVVTAYEPDPSDANHEPLQRQLPLAEEEHGPVWPFPACGEAANAGAGVLPGTSPACQLCQLLHRQ